MRALFDSIAYRYDFLNHLLSFGIDILWRFRAIQILKQYKAKNMLDVATGTADFAIKAAELNPDQIIGIDISSNMIEIGKKKIANKNLAQIIKLETGEAEHLKFESEYFDIVMAAFGVRNFENLNLGLSEFYRVLQKGGVAMILEFSKPKNFPVKQLYKLYSKYIVPIIGGRISQNKMAYKYLPNTISEFPDGELFCKILKSVGFNKTYCYPQTFGIASIYLAIK